MGDIIWTEQDSELLILFVGLPIVAAGVVAIGYTLLGVWGGLAAAALYSAGLLWSPAWDSPRIMLTVFGVAPAWIVAFGLLALQYGGVL